MENKRLDFLVVVVLLIVGGATGFYLESKNILLGFLYLGVPSLYLLIRKRKNYKKFFWGILIFGIIFGAIFDFIATINGTWAVERVSISWLKIGAWTPENIIGYIWMTLFGLVFYEHFLDDERKQRLSNRHSKIFLYSLLILALVTLIYTISPNLLKFSFFYFWAGLAAVSFPIIFSFYNPHIISKFATLTFFFFFVWLALEFIGLKNNNWLFVGNQYIGSVNFFGVSFPIEEVLFWFLWYPVVIVAYYEYFIDDNK